MGRVDAFIFDLDGTLMDSEILYVEATKEALAQRGVEISRQESIELIYGRGWSLIWADVCERFSGSYARSEEMEAVIRSLFHELRSRLDIRIEGSINLLKRLSVDFPVAVVSGSPRADVEAGVDLLGIGTHIEFFMGSEDYYSGKPDPTCFLVAADRMQVEPACCLIFEDSFAGVCAAKAAGMYCVALRRDNAPPQDLAEADLILADLSDFDLTTFLSER